jgi:hypothetical protein
MLFTAKFSSADAFALVSFFTVGVPLQLNLITVMFTQIYTLVIKIKIRQKLPQSSLFLIIQSQLYYFSLTYLTQALDQILTLTQFTNLFEIIIMPCVGLMLVLSYGVYQNSKRRKGLLPLSALSPLL